MKDGTVVLRDMETPRSGGPQAGLVELLNKPSE